MEKGTFLRSPPRANPILFRAGGLADSNPSPPSEGTAPAQRGKTHS